jgi:uncharacterized protein YgbK (DUF1537 family)
VGAELEGLLQAVGDRKVIVAPAVPRIGRITKGGLQFIGGTPIHEGEFAKDPSWPIFSASVLENIRRTGEIKCDVCDAESDEDLDRIVDVALQQLPVVLVGSVGLADALARRVQGGGQATRPYAAGAKRPAVISGSSYRQTHAQLEWAALRWGVSIRDIRPHAAEEGGVGLGWSPPFILRISPDILKENSSPSQIIDEFCIRAVAVLKYLRPDAFVLIGGDTTYRIMNEFGVESLVVDGRVVPGVSTGHLVGGIFNELPFVLKGGSVGDLDIVSRMIDYLCVCVCV